MASIAERTTSKGDRRLFVVWRDRAGKQHWTGVNAKTVALLPTEKAHGIKAAQRLKADIESSVARTGTWGSATKDEPEAVTVASYFETWIQRHERKVTERVSDNYRRSFRLYIDPKLGATPLEELRRRHVQALIDDLIDSGSARNSVRNVIAPPRRMLRDAIRDELIDTNPASDVEIPKNAPARKAIIPTPEELQQIRAAADQDTLDAIDLMASLGLRRGELFALRWADIDLTENLLTVQATNHRGIVSERTKTEAGLRLVPLFPSARGVLQERRRRLGGIPHPTAFVFANAAGGPVDPTNSYRRSWGAACRKAGLVVQVEADGKMHVRPKYHAHDLRHYAATMLDEQGLVGKTRTEIIGHANEEMTNSIYTHVRRERISSLATSGMDPLAGVVSQQQVSR